MEGSKKAFYYTIIGCTLVLLWAIWDLPSAKRVDEANEDIICEINELQSEVEELNSELEDLKWKIGDIYSYADQIGIDTSKIIEILDENNIKDKENKREYLGKIEK